MGNPRLFFFFSVFFGGQRRGEDEGGEGEAKKLMAEGKADAAELHEKSPEKAKKKVELVSPLPKIVTNVIQVLHFT
ncbi:hypothetical protein NL676_031761 [Syzygium grande]|nr:hypothetical protein NL676_031761 [Syzygium grande]